MSHWNRKMQGVENKDVRFCHLCGAEVYPLRFANGDPYLTDVLDEGRGRFVIIGAGNNFNFKPHHDCAKSAENRLRSAESTYAQLYADHAAAKSSMEALESDENKAFMSRSNDPQLLETLKRIHATTEATLKRLEEQKLGVDAYLAKLRSDLESLRHGRTIIPEGKPAVGRTARVVKGRKVQVGTTGKIVWIGLDSFKDGSIRVGIETADKVRHYTSADNIEIVIV